ncbi:MAG: caspase family protein, partial [Bacteroidales bacterium]|nr:caspase family protein [Bacteroidales bacterium]
MFIKILLLSVLGNIWILCLCQNTPGNNELINTYALIIGIADYQEVTDLEFADKDARAFASFLTSKSGGSVNQENIKIFVNEEATANNIGDAFTWLLNITKPGDRVYIFYAGHGDVESLETLENGLLLLHKAPKESYLAFGYDYLPILALKKVVLGLTSKETEIIVITDACHSGNLAGGETGIYSTSLQ